jgi:K+/H+ antiporter YhaU regulatory subunit KhtT
VIVAVRHHDGGLDPQPSPQTTINPGDMLVALGSPEALERLETLFQPASART